MAFPSPARDYSEQPINLVAQLIKDPDATFFYKVDTDSMINASIPIGAIVLVDRSLSPVNGSMVVARLQGKDLLRILIRNQYKSFLCPANSKYQPILVTSEMEVQILGVVTCVINQAKDWSHVCTR